MRLKRESPDPLYAQIKDLLHTDIEAGRYRVNDRLPSERELAAVLKGEVIAHGQLPVELPSLFPLGTSLIHEEH